VFGIVLNEGLDVAAAKAKAGIKEFDEATLRAAVQDAMTKNTKAVAEFKAGKEQAKMALVGMVMKAMKGAPNEIVRRLVDEELAKSQLVL
jgi:aspartyl-tRNA(Asn)/glutamyl-tRNA(Gln) amidotransferase subunit B